MSTPRRRPKNVDESYDQIPLHRYRLREAGDVAGASLRRYLLWEGVEAEVQGNRKDGWVLLLKDEDEIEVWSRWTEANAPRLGHILQFLLADLARMREEARQRAERKVIARDKREDDIKLRKSERILNACDRILRNEPPIERRRLAARIHDSIPDATLQYIRRVLKDKRTSHC